MLCTHWSSTVHHLTHFSLRLLRVPSSNFSSISPSIPFLFGIQIFHTDSNINYQYLPIPNPALSAGHRSRRLYPLKNGKATLKRSQLQWRIKYSPIPKPCPVSRTSLTPTTILHWNKTLKNVQYLPIPKSSKCLYTQIWTTNI